MARWDELDGPTAMEASSPKQQTRRERLIFQRATLQSHLGALDKALAALDAHPELEEFIETLSRAGQ